MGKLIFTTCFHSREFLTWGCTPWLCAVVVMFSLNFLLFEAVILMALKSTHAQEKDCEKSDRSGLLYSFWNWSVFRIQMQLKWTCIVLTGKHKKASQGWNSPLKRTGNSRTPLQTSKQTNKTTTCASGQVFLSGRTNRVYRFWRCS